MTPRLLVLLVGFYVALDLSNPFMPGAFCFDAASSVEGAQRTTARAADAAPGLIAVRAPLGIVVETSALVSPARRPPTVTASRRGAPLRRPPAVPDPAPPSSPDH